MFLTLLSISCNSEGNEGRFLNMQSNFSEEDILATLDNSAKDGSAGFVSLGHPYSYLIDSRINLFMGSENNWAIAVERLGYNPRAGLVLLEVFYYGNCLKNLKVEINSDCGYNTYEPINRVNFLSTITEKETVKPDSETWIVRSQTINIGFTRQELIKNEIEMDTAREDIGIEAVARLAAKRHPNLFRATDEELYRAIPGDLKKILVLDEWYHKDFYLLPMEDEVADYKKQNKEIWLKDRPSSYETGRQLAKVLVSGDTSFYKPTVKANTHWKNWPESGSL
jgi:hypothetical protein